MARMFEVIDYDEEKRRKVRLRLTVSAVIISLGLFSFPHVKQYMPKWRALKTARKLALYIQQLKTEAVLRKKPFEVRFVEPQTIEVYDVASCGVGGNRQKRGEKSLSEFSPNVEFVSRDVVSQNIDAPGAMIKRFCYDPLYGSSLPVDGLLHGGVYLAYSTAQSPLDSPQIVQMLIVGANGDIELQ